MHLVAIDLTGQDPEHVADRCWQAGAAGLWEADEHSWRVGVERAALPGFLAALADLRPVDVTDSDAVELAGRATSVPFHGRAIDLWVPATVFGDGHHPTTRSCLDLLALVVRPGDRVLDVGSGAGALSVAAALLRGDVTAVDIDPEALAATRDNAGRNGVAVTASATTLAHVEGGYDVVVANMTVGALRPLIPALLGHTRPGASVVLSGMLEHQWPDIRSRVGGTVTDRHVDDGWVTARVVLDG